MKSKIVRDSKWVLRNAKVVASKLKLNAHGTRLRIRIPYRTAGTNTDGWSAVIGNLGKNQPKLEIWGDRFSGYPDRKFYAGFRSESREQITSLVNRVKKTLWPVRIVSTKDTEEDRFLVLADRLSASEFNAPVLEKYRDGRTFYGVYAPTRASGDSANSHFTELAVAFFEDVARSLPKAATDDATRDIYPQIENRKSVVSHLRRERSKLLAAQCKLRDNYHCRVCGLSFEQIYGKLGHGFAEAHHRVPLGKLRDNVRTNPRDLATVCANCHRMLHRMSGEWDDVPKLRVTVRRNRESETVGHR